MRACLVVIAFFVCHVSAVKYFDSDYRPRDIWRLLGNDVVVSPKQRVMHRLRSSPKAISIKEKRNNRWKDGVVPYALSNHYNSLEKKIIRNAMTVIEEKSCFRFVQRTRQRDYLTMEKRSGCYSFVGKIGGPQIISLASGCMYTFIIIHELMHALGFEHEHQRPDRDAYLRIVYDNVDPEMMPNFEKVRSSDVDYLDHPYDYSSIMHYDATAFGKKDQRSGQRLVTMIPLKANVQLLDNYELSELDVEKLNTLGQCNAKSSQNNVQPSDCRDILSDCPEYAEKSLCKNALYLDLIRQYCPRTCGFC